MQMVGFVEEMNKIPVPMVGFLRNEQDPGSNVVKDMSKIPVQMVGFVKK